MNTKFADVKPEEGVVTLLRQEDKIKDYDVMFEFWQDGNITAVSAIFLKEDVQHLGDEAIIEMVQEECNTPKVILSKVNEKYLFANYGWKEID